MKIFEVTDFLESIAPISSQESYDNSGLIIGQKDLELTKALITLDCTEAVVQEAIDTNCNLIIAHHPIVFKGLKSLTGKNYVERTVLKAIKNDIAIYAIHTNLDNYRLGVNKIIGNKLGIPAPKILSPTSATLNKLAVYVPASHKSKVIEALFKSGAGSIGEYDECSFSAVGNGTFKAGNNTNPFVGEKGKRHVEEEVKIEVIVSSHKINQCVKAMIMAHPYEEVAYDIYSLLNKNYSEGAGMYGDLESEISTTEFLSNLKSIFKADCVRHTDVIKSKIKRIAWCGGSGSFLLSTAKNVGADIFITGDFKYHEFFDADNQIVIADVGHFESEQYTVNLIAELLAKKFSNFAAYLSKINTNPIKYL